MRIGDQIGSKANELKKRVNATTVDTDADHATDEDTSDGTARGGLRATTAAMIDKIVRHDDGPW
ncbi:hypothetical protein [Tomitella gaofuii]|uniref:hypothetical protein n=1 Tax=Tomitella gaofuii TaxID=2760083 RepID=UPI0015FDE0F7|nr:hypothetical protein [Tomitella gaofuii]